MSVTRDDILKAVLAMKADNILFEGCTGLGKTKIGLKKALSLTNPKEKILVLVPKLVLIKNWKDEIKKWNLPITRFDFMCYASFIRKAGEYSVCIGDEFHHATDTVLEAYKNNYVIKHMIMLSATVPQSRKFKIQEYMQYDSLKVSIQDAVEEAILPEPEYWVIPMNLEALRGNFTIVKNPSKKKVVNATFKQRFMCKDKAVRYNISCTAQEKYAYIENLIQFFETKGLSSMKKVYCAQRLKALAEFKTALAKDIIKLMNVNLPNEKMLLFCADIEQTEKIGNAYHSKMKLKNRDKVLESFNNGNIKYLSACATLDEGVNLKSCRFGLFVYTPASEVKQIQRVGRNLRHQKPIILLPFFRNTREEEIIDKMIDGTKYRFVNPSELFKTLRECSQNQV